MRFYSWMIPMSMVGLVAIVVSCGSSNQSASQPVYDANGVPIAMNNPALTGAPAMSPETLKRQVNIRRDLIPSGRHARRYKRRMNPRYITIHSTQNYSPQADAMQHSRALKNGKLRAYKRRGGNRIGYLVWHYSIDENRVVQHLPDNEQGEHADFDGPGNNYSLGLEMCENRGSSRARTTERTAMLAAYLMHKHKIPIQNIKAHYHWARYGLRKPHKNCPHFLMDNGVPGRRWAAFVNKINGYYKMISQRTAAPRPMPLPAPQPAPAPLPAPVPIPNPYNSYDPYQGQRNPYAAPPSRPAPNQRPYSNSNNPYGVPSLPNY